MPLNVVEPRRLYQVVVGQIAGLIRTEEFRVDDRLPTDRELVRQLMCIRPENVQVVSSGSTGDNVFSARVPG